MHAIAHILSIRRHGTQHMKLCNHTRVHDFDRYGSATLSAARALDFDLLPAIVVVVVVDCPVALFQTRSNNAHTVVGTAPPQAINSYYVRTRLLAASRRRQNPAHTYTQRTFQLPTYDMRHNIMTRTAAAVTATVCCAPKTTTYSLGLNMNHSCKYILHNRYGGRAAGGAVQRTGRAIRDDHQTGFRSPNVPTPSSHDSPGESPAQAHTQIVNMLTLLCWRCAIDQIRVQITHG